MSLVRWSCDAAQLREMTEEEQRKLKSKLRTRRSNDNDEPTRCRLTVGRSGEEFVETRGWGRSLSAKHTRTVKCWLC